MLTAITRNWIAPLHFALHVGQSRGFAVSASQVFLCFCGETVLLHLHPQRRHGKDELEEVRISPEAATQPPKNRIVTQLEHPVDGKSRLPALHVKHSSVVLVPILHMRVVPWATAALCACGFGWLLQNPHPFIQTAKLLLLFG